jgi:hypothetical protein
VLCQAKGQNNLSSTCLLHLFCNRITWANPSVSLPVGGTTVGLVDPRISGPVLCKMLLMHSTSFLCPGSVRRHTKPSMSHTLQNTKHTLNTRKTLSAGVDMQKHTKHTSKHTVSKCRTRTLQPQLTIRKVCQTKLVLLNCFVLYITHAERST